MTYPPRPQWNHPEAKTLAAKECVEEVRAWASTVGCADAEGDDAEFCAVLALALQESPDAYGAGRYLEDFIGWKVNGDLIRILDRAFGRAKYLVTPLIHAWVMEHKVRFPAKDGEAVHIRIGDLELKAKVVSVIKREARAICEPINNPGKKLSVNAEEVLNVIKLGSNDTGPNDFPTGGTPVAAALSPLRKVVNG